MTRKCGKCGIPAPDDEALFCNRCGSGIIEETEPEFPLCPSCGNVVSDELAEFCNRCGSRILQGPVPPVCPGCGNEAIDSASLFCTRCGTPFIHDKKSPKMSKPLPATPPAPSVVVKQRKSAVTKPPRQDPVPDWDPWTDDSPVDEPAVNPHPQAQKKYAHLPMVADELAVPAQRTEKRSEPQISISSKKYAHLPLIADELKDKNSRTMDYDMPDIPVPSGKGRKPPQKKGMLGLFKK
ncbi:zinc ribbon domain-containing protein [uncultured Methanoregula sp.]|uniref:zinc ribbon domain-containing protein n=1 Tax=uncultured Methanoregula sp. TaxID=1005933 RepID=UPI002AAB2291|nr:zinc ribbon domain-containing protein [uncultured Methanoregula sp.]